MRRFPPDFRRGLTAYFWAAAVSGALLLVGLSARAQDSPDALIRLVSRPGVTTGYWWMPRGAGITVLLISGGSGGIGLRDGKPQSANFLIRSRDLFAQAGLNVALLAQASDMPTLSTDQRISTAHLQDIRAVVADIRKRQGGAVWVVGTSMGTVSATASAIALGAGPDGIDGVVLTSSVTERRWGPSAIANQDLARITQPVLVHHHRRDACAVTQAWLAAGFLPLMTQARVKKFIDVDGGQSPSGPPCEALHYHGYIGLEAETVAQIVAWIKKPVD